MVAMSPNLQMETKAKGGILSSAKRMLGGESFFINTYTSANEPGLIFKLGMGEIPWVQQVTFSIWRDAKDMRKFAYRSGAHADAIRLAREGKWFKEDLFARFRIVASEGTWAGQKLSLEPAKIEPASLSPPPTRTAAL